MIGLAHLVIITAFQYSNGRNKEIELIESSASIEW